MNIDHVAIGVWPNVAIAAGTNPKDAKDAYNARYRDMYERDDEPANLENLARYNLGSIGVFTDCACDKDQVRKILEEAAEVYGAWQTWDNNYQRLANACNVREVQARELREHDSKAYLIEECADVIQAVANMLCALGVTDLAPYLRATERKNYDRGHDYMEVEQ